MAASGEVRDRLRGESHDRRQFLNPYDVSRAEWDKGFIVRDTQHAEAVPIRQYRVSVESGPHWHVRLLDVATTSPNVLRDDTGMPQ
jgi:hypothetical protein